MPADAERHGDVGLDGRRRVALFEEHQQVPLHHGVGLVEHQRGGGVPEIGQDIVMQSALRQLGVLEGIAFVVVGNRPGAVGRALRRGWWTVELACLACWQPTTSRMRDIVRAICHDADDIDG